MSADTMRTDTMHEDSFERRFGLGRFLLLVGALFAVLLLLHGALWSWLSLGFGEPVLRPWDPTRTSPAPPRVEEWARGSARAGAGTEPVLASERQLLGSYGWIDEPASIARIPLARAIELRVAREGGGPAEDSPGAGEEQR